MALEFRRGLAAIEEAASRKGGSGTFRPFVPRIEWREDGENRHVLVLTPIEEVPAVALHEWIPVGKGEKSNGEEYTKWESFISRKDAAIGEDYDDLEDRLERTPKTRHLGVMVELEAIMESVDGRKKIKGFTVKTDTYTRKTDDGEEEVTQPVVGICTASAQTVWGPLGSLDQSQGPLIDIPMEITRRGKDQNTRYDIIPLLEKPVDLSPLLEYLDGISFLSQDEDFDELENAVEAATDDVEAAQIIADAILNKRLAELADGERYEELVSPLELSDMPKGFGGGGKKKSAPKSRPARPERPARRRAEASEATEEAPAEKPKAPSKADRFAALKSRVEK